MPLDKAPEPKVFLGGVCDEHNPNWDSTSKTCFFEGPKISTDWDFPGWSFNCVYIDAKNKTFTGKCIGSE